MHKKEAIFSQEYRIGDNCYILNKTEIRCVNQSRDKNKFSIPLNEVDPNYSYGGTFSPLWLLFIGYLIFGTIARGVQWISGSPVYDTAGNIQLIIFPLLLVFAGKRFYYHLKQTRAYSFYYLKNGEIAFSLPINKKNKTQTQEFVHTIVDRIRNVTPSNDHVLFLLREYHLLTKSEETQLDAYIQQKNNQSRSQLKENIIKLN